MRALLTLGIAVVLLGCASTTQVAPSTAEDVGKVTYFDDNVDGIVDYEFHDFGCCDRNWALADTDFDGYFDLRAQWGYAYSETLVEQAVPYEVAITPAKSGWRKPPL